MKNNDSVNAIPKGGDAVNRYLYAWTKEHEELDNHRFERISERLNLLPREIKEQVNGSVEATVNKQMINFVRWIGIGTFLLLGSMGVLWGSNTNQLDTNTKKLDTVLTDKDLVNIETQLKAQAAVINAIQTDVTFIKQQWLKPQ
jgi:hypothetical protein